MIFYKIIGLVFLIIFLSSCVPDNVLTKEEIDNQDKAARVVTNTLFENDLDVMASYNIRKDGLVVIKFDQSVSEVKFTKIVNLLRANPDIQGLRAEQGGIEVCPLQP